MTMSQYHFSTSDAGDPVAVHRGWDRPLGHYVMDIDPDWATIVGIRTVRQAIDGSLDGFTREGGS